MCEPDVTTSVESINGVIPPKISAPILYTIDSVRNLTLVWNILGNTEGITPSNVDINSAMINKPKITKGNIGILINQKANTENKLKPTKPNIIVRLLPILSLYHPKKNTAGIMSNMVIVLNIEPIVPPKLIVVFKNEGIYDNTM